MRQKELLAATAALLKGWGGAGTTKTAIGHPPMERDVRRRPSDCRVFRRALERKAEFGLRVRRESAVDRDPMCVYICLHIEIHARLTP
jgi:hypothetical protein